MLSKISTPKTKTELIRAVQKLYNPKINVYEVLDPNGLEKVQREIKQTLRRNPISIIVVEDP